VIGLDGKWEGGDIARYPGGGQKVNLLRDAIEQYKDDPKQVILFVDRFVLIH